MRRCAVRVSGEFPRTRSDSRAHNPYNLCAPRRRGGREGSRAWHSLAFAKEEGDKIVLDGMFPVRLDNVEIATL